MYIEYITGLFDGEGDCGIRKYRATKNGKYYYRAVARISNSNKECLEFVKDFFGFGWVGKVNKGIKFGRNKQMYQYVVQNKKAIYFLKSVLPYSIIKKEKINEILESQYCGVEQ